MKQKKTILMGYSGHAIVVNDCLLPDHLVIGYTDLELKADNPLNLEFFGEEQSLDRTTIRSHYFFPAVGENLMRKKLRNFLKDNALNETQAIHPTAAVSPSAKIGLSTMIGPNAVVNGLTSVGNGVIVNSGAIVEHDCVVEDYVHLAPGVVLAGNVRIEENAFIGANATVKEGVTIGENTIIGAGAVVIKDVPANETWAGVPAKKIKNVV